MSKSADRTRGARAADPHADRDPFAERWVEERDLVGALGALLPEGRRGAPRVTSRILPGTERVAVGIAFATSDQMWFLLDKVKGQYVLRASARQLTPEVLRRGLAPPRVASAAHHPDALAAFVSQLDRALASSCA